jgi:hypothetical protein
MHFSGGNINFAVVADFVMANLVQNGHKYGYDKPISGNQQTKDEALFTIPSETEASIVLIANRTYQTPIDGNVWALIAFCAGQLCPSEVGYTQEWRVGLEMSTNCLHVHLSAVNIAHFILINIEAQDGVMIQRLLRHVPRCEQGVCPVLFGNAVDIEVKASNYRVCLRKRCIDVESVRPVLLHVFVPLRTWLFFI